MRHLMRSCCVFDSPRLLHFPLLAVYPIVLSFPPGHQLHLPRCGGQIPCALLLMRTLAPLPSTTLSQKQAHCNSAQSSTVLLIGPAMTDLPTSGFSMQTHMILTSGILRLLSASALLHGIQAPQTPPQSLAEYESL